MLTVLLIIIAASYLFEAVLGYLNVRNWSRVVPDTVSDIYPDEKYKKARDYSLTNYRFSEITKLFSFLLMVVILVAGGFGWLDAFVRNYSGNPLIISMLFFGILGIASDLVSTPFELYKTFIIEEKFGFNKTTIKTFFSDKVKGYLVAAILGGGILAVLVKVFNITGENFWWITWLFLSAIILLLTVFYTSWLLPLFNKLTPLADGGLRKNILEYCTRNNFPLNDIYVMDGSKRSAKANAFFSGLGRKKKIVLFDTLINNHSKEELVAVLAHETGHYKLKHTRTGLIVAILQLGLMLFLFSLLQGNKQLTDALGAAQTGLHLELLAFGILYSPVSLITGIFMNILSRRNEYEADSFAKKTFSGIALINALKKLSADNLSNLTPHPAYVFVHYSHPPLLKRLEALADRK
jgi:STE24 endopeptidase